MRLPVTLVNIQINSLNHELYGAGVQAAVSYSDFTDDALSTSCFVSFINLVPLWECFDDLEAGPVSMFQLGSIGIVILQSLLFIDMTFHSWTFNDTLAAARALGRC